MSSEKNYTEYKRRKISLLDIISKIGALFITFILFIFLFLNIIQKILIIIKLFNQYLKIN